MKIFQRLVYNPHPLHISIKYAYEMYVASNKGVIHMRCVTNVKNYRTLLKKN